MLLETRNMRIQNLIIKAESWFLDEKISYTIMTNMKNRLLKKMEKR